MKSIGILFSKYKSYYILAVLCLAIGVSVGIFAQGNKQVVIQNINDVKFKPLNPQRPEAHQLATLWGDMATGPSSIILKFKKGEADLHYHTSDYHLIVLKGTMKYWIAGQAKADAKPMNEGTYWFQPGNESHGEYCITDECTLFVKWDGKQDSILADKK